MSYKIRLEIINKITGECRLSLSTFASEKIAQEHIDLLRQLATSNDPSVYHRHRFLSDYEYRIVDTSKKRGRK